MYQKERIDTIMNILKTYSYVSVKFLTKELDYSTATINRDLNLMEKLELVKRSYGGVELIKRKTVPIPFRYDIMKTAKNKMAKAASELVNNSDTVFIDASTTAEYLGRHLIEKKNLTVITNNMGLISFLSERGINAICLGGKVVEPPYMLNGNTTVENAMKYNADICFFSTGSITPEGMINSSELYYLLHKTMVKNSKKSYYMADHEKINFSDKMNLFDLNSISGIITDYSFDTNIKESFPNCDFIEVN